MDSKEFVSLEPVERRGMIERGEVMSGILVDPKHGVNPSLRCCFWCGEAIDLLLFGKMRKEAKKALGMRQIDTEAPHKVAVGHDPCKACAERMDRGICFMEITDKENPEPTGRYWVVNVSAVRRIVKGEAMIAEILTKRKSWITMETAIRCGLYDRRG